MSDTQQALTSQEAIVQTIREHSGVIRGLLGLPQLSSCRQQSIMKGSNGLGTGMIRMSGWSLVLNPSCGYRWHLTTPPICRRS